MKKKLTTLLLIMVMVLSLLTPALAVDDEQYLQQSDLAAFSEQVEGDEAVAMAVEEASDSATGVTQQEAARFLLFYAGMKESQLGTYPDDYNAMAESVGLTKNIEWAPAELCTVEEFNTMLQNVQVLYDAMHKDVKQPLFVDGLAQPIFEYSDPTQGNLNEDGEIHDGVVRFCVYVETNYDTDGDGKLDLVKALVQLPRETLDGLKVPTIYEARPYITGCTDGSVPYVDGKYDLESMYSQPAKRTPAGTYTTTAAVENANPDDWYYWNEYENMYDYEDLTWYDYYLVRGYAVVECGGLGTKGSDGFETCGTDLEIDAFKCVIEWLHGDRVAYTDKTSNLAITADWSTGKVGMTGRSYAGTTQFGLATTGVEGLETIVPVAGIASWYEYTNSQGVSTGGVAYSDWLALYCCGRYLDKEDYGTIADKYGRYLTQIMNDQLALNGNYGKHWATRDYTVNAKNIKCPALIVHGLNDTNVRTKEFDLMYKAYQEVGVPVKLLLHQGTHLTPTYPSQQYEMYTDGELYDTVLNRWFSHYLYGVDNGAENMAAVTVQSNVDGSWTHYDSWDTENSVTYALDAENHDSSTVARGSTATYTFEVPEDITVQGAVAVTFTAKPTSDKIDELDGIRLTANLTDNSSEDFMAYVPSRSYLPITTISENGGWMGGGVPNFRLVQYAQTATKSKSIGQGYIDLYNPTAGYDSASAATRTALKNGESYTYTVYLQPSVYTVKAGHTLQLTLSLSSRDISIEVDNAKSCMTVPVHSAAAQSAIDAETAHTIVTDAAVRATCTQAGKTAGSHCATCGDVIVAQQEIPATGHRWGEWTVTKAATGTEEGEETRTCSACHETETRTIAKLDNPFTDVAEGAYYYDAVLALTEQGVIKGMSETTFAPDTNLTRAHVVTMLYRMAGEPETDAEFAFTDVPENAYYADALAWAVEAGIAEGVSETEFAPELDVTREELATFLYRFAVMQENADGQKSDLAEFADAASVSDWAQEAMAWAVGQGLVKGTSETTIEPAGTATRAQAATLLYRYEQLG